MKDGLRSEKAKLDGEMCGDWDDLGAPLMSTPTALDDSASFFVCDIFNPNIDVYIFN